MARTKQKVRDEWQEKKRLLVEAQQAASGQPRAVALA